MKYVRVETKKHGEIYDGVVIEQDAREFRIICAGPDETSAISIKKFKKREVTIEARTKEQIKSWLEAAMVETDRKICNLEFDLLFAQKDRDRRNILLKQAMR